GHHVGVTCEREVLALLADAGIKVFDRRRAGFAEGDAKDLEARPFQHAFDETERATFGRRHRLAAEKIAGEHGWVGGRDAHRRAFSRPCTVASMRMPPGMLPALRRRAQRIGAIAIGSYRPAPATELNEGPNGNSEPAYMQNN